MNFAARANQNSWVIAAATAAKSAEVTTLVAALCAVLLAQTRIALVMAQFAIVSAIVEQSSPHPRPRRVPTEVHNRAGAVLRGGG